jgi:hypothetical protein
MLLGREEVGNVDGVLVGAVITGFSVRDLLVGYSVGTSLGTFLGDLLDLEKVGNDDGAGVGNFVLGLPVGDLVGKFVGISICSRDVTPVAVVVVVSSLSTET